jgi:hypothetical protein
MERVPSWEDAYELWGEFGLGIMDFHIVGGA